MLHDQGKAPRWLGVTMAILLVSWVVPTASSADEFKMSRGDRVVFLGATFIERMQDTSYVETELTMRSHGSAITFRNLGWSGDTVGGVSRAVFGKPTDGFIRLMRDVKATRPTVLVVCYGANEAHLGPEGLTGFVKGANQLLDNLAPLNARMVIMSPLAHEKTDAPLPSPTRYNRSLASYVSALKSIADKRGYHFVATQAVADSTSGSLMDNGIHLSDRGYWALAPGVASALSAPRRQWSVTLQAGKSGGQYLGVTVSGVQSTQSRIGFDALSERLPYPDAPRVFDAKAPCLPPEAEVGQRYLKIGGLKGGEYTIQVDGVAVARASAKTLATGMTLDASWEQEQVQRLRELIVAKNKLYFHRYRPQNETYLFLFRKREQGNNAVEIPQFDPLVEGVEQKIAETAKPVMHRFEIVRTKK
ncbi:MAG: SGNH/GDSL hydrolase family protein [Planctomycetaceae bacterium]|nr:SGNH/GDSL hydrolase family protein [Planctomycetaceae bacterium]